MTTPNRDAATDPRRAKLPKWAQQELTRLERDLEYAKAKLTAGPDDSNTFADPYINPRPLGDSPTIEFQLPGGRLRARIDGDYLDLNGDTSIVFMPRASNSGRLKVDRHA